MFCPFCKSNNTKVIDKRDNEETNTSRRRRECEDCGKRFTTYERIEKVILNVLKRDGRIEEFSRDKVKAGILRAVKKRNIPERKLEKLIDDIEQKLMIKSELVTSTVEIGEMVLRGLNEIDKLGALLFAAVYKDFNSLEDVEKEMKRLSEKK